MMMRVLCLLLLAAVWLTAARARVEFVSSAEVAPGAVFLSDIAQISGDSALVRRLASLEVARVDKPGRETRVSANAVKGFFVRSVTDPAQVDFVGEGSVKVKARAGQVKEDSVRTLLRQAVRVRMGVLQEGKDWELEAERLPRSLAVPEKGGLVVVELSPRFSGIGQEVANVKVFSGDKLLTNQSIAYKIRRWDSVVRLRNDLRKGEEVRAVDVETVREEVTFQQRKILRATSEAVGRNTIRAVRSGDLLVDNWLETPYAVREGDRIRLLTQVGSTVVQTVAIARQSAFRGQTILVENADSRKTLQAKVSGQAEAWVVN